MQKLMDREFLLKAALPALVVVALAFAMVTMTYGWDTVVRGAHDTFHDFRHTIGMPCH